MVTLPRDELGGISSLGGNSSGLFRSAVVWLHVRYNGDALRCDSFRRLQIGRVF